MISRAYPRWRGGNLLDLTAAQEVTGLSPLARGKQIPHRPHHAPPGPIPAGAGETPTLASLMDFLKAYPRWRGGNTHFELAKKPAKGLSPLARGKPI